MKGKPNLRVFEEEIKDALLITGDPEMSLDILLAALQQGDKLVLAHGGHVSLTTFGQVRAVGREAVLEALERSNDVVQD